MGPITEPQALQHFRGGEPPAPALDFPGFERSTSQKPPQCWGNLPQVVRCRSRGQASSLRATPVMGLPGPQPRCPCAAGRCVSSALGDGGFRSPSTPEVEGPAQNFSGLCGCLGLSSVTGRGCWADSQLSPVLLATTFLPPAPCDPHVEAAGEAAVLRV